jgi:hypothetical protein
MNREKSKRIVMKEVRKYLATLTKEELIEEIMNDLKEKNK